MAKLIPYDVEGVETSGGTGVKPPVGVAPCRIVSAEQREKKKSGDPANDIVLALDFGSEYDWLYEYVGLDIDWKLAEFIRAIGLKDKGKLDLDKHAKGKVIRAKVNPAVYNGQPTVEIGRLMKAQPGDEEKIGQAVNAASSNGDGPDEEEDGTPTASGKEYPGGPEFVPSREGDEETGSYDDWGDDDLEAECTDRGVTLAGGRGKKRDKMIKALRDEDAEVLGGADGEEPEAEAEPAADGDDYDEWDLDRLKQEWEEREMGDLPAIRGRNAETRMKAALVEAIREDDKANPFDA